MADAGDETMRNIHEYAQKVRSPQEQEPPVLADTLTSQVYEHRLDQTIQELQERVKQQRVILNQIKATTSGNRITRQSTDKREKLNQLDNIRAAYDKLAQSEPSLPSIGSALPTVLALRTLQRTITGSKDAIATTRRDLATTQAQLQRERATLANNEAANAALQVRIASLQDAAAQRAQREPHDVENELVGTRQAKKLDYERETLRLHDALVKFTHDHLGVMIAAEELGGPVVGEDTEIDEADLADGFAKGKKRKAREMDNDARQKRIDEIWGHVGAHVDEHGHGNEEETPSERDAAAREVHGLIERLIQALIGREGEGVYVRLERDSAAARFLIRAKVAEYHPKDARRLRLVDFGREFDG